MRLDGLSLAYRSHMGIRNDGWLRLGGPVFWLELILMMLVTAPFWWASKALPSVLDYRDRTDLPVLDTPYLCNTPACDHRIFLVVCNI